MSTQEGPGLGEPDFGEPSMFIMGPDGNWLLPDGIEFDFNVLSERPVILPEEALATPEFEDEPEVAVARDRPRRKNPAAEKLTDFRSHGGFKEPSKESSTGWAQRRDKALLKSGMSYESEWPDTMMAPGKRARPGALHSPSMQAMFEAREAELTTMADDPSMVEMFKSHEASLEISQIVGLIAVGVEAQFQIDEFERAEEDTAEEAPKVVFGEGVVATVPLKRYPRVERVAAWRSEGKPGRQPGREKIGEPFARVRTSSGERFLFEDDWHQDYPPLRRAEMLLSRRLVQEAFDAMETMQASDRASEVAEADQRAKAEAAEFEALNGPKPEPSVLDSPLFSKESVQEFRAFQNRRGAA